MNASRTVISPSSSLWMFPLLVLCGVVLGSNDASIREEHLPILPGRVLDKDAGAAYNASSEEFGANSPVVLCRFLPADFIWCEPPFSAETLDPANDPSSVTKSGGAAASAKTSVTQNHPGDAPETVGCRRWGGRRYEEVERTRVRCHALKGIECRGNRTFLRGSVPCIHYSGHHFLTTLLYSLLLGFLGIDRFCLGHTGSAVGKLLTLGGLGVWWLVDIVLLIVGDLRPADDSNWMPYY